MVTSLPPGVATATALSSATASTSTSQPPRRCGASWRPGGSGWRWWRRRGALGGVARAQGPSVECHPYDQADQRSIEALATAAGAVDVLVNNAGIMARTPLLETGAGLLREIVAVDLVGVVALTTLVARGM